MTKSLISWLSRQDVLASKGDLQHGAELIRGTLAESPHDVLHLLVGAGEAQDPDFSEQATDHFVQWLTSRVEVAVEVHHLAIRSPIHYGDLYERTRDVLAAIIEADGAPNCAALVTPGTPQMHAVWLLLCKTSFPITMLEFQRVKGGASVVQEVSAPFDISADYIPAIVREKHASLTELAVNAPRVRSAFQDIQTQDTALLTEIRNAQIFAVTELPVLILGESGTGKELFARAIHTASPRHRRPLVVVNCGAIAPNLVDSELFGYVKGAFTGATKDKAGYFDAANGSTIFLDEFGELPLGTQVKLLRVLNDGRFVPVGGVTERSVDVRVIAATNRDLQAEMAAGRFREDLFYRVAVGVISLPPLRARGRDLALLTDEILKELVSSEALADIGAIDKKLSVGAKNVIRAHPWPGNIRELRGALIRAVLSASGEIIGAEEMRAALFQKVGNNGGVLDRPLGEGFDIQTVLDEVRRHYVVRALAAASHRKTQAADLLGLNNYQTLSKWMKDLGVD